MERKVIQITYREDIFPIEVDINCNICDLKIILSKMRMFKCKPSNLSITYGGLYPKENELLSKYNMLHVINKNDEAWDL